MGKRQKKQPEGAPLWIVSYGDMMSLLLTFFILLASMANFDEVHDKFMTAMQSIREALGMHGQVGKNADPHLDFASMMKRLESIIKPNMTMKKGDSKEKGVYGKNFRLTKIRDGMKIAIGGPVLFDSFSAELNDQGKEAIDHIAEELKGYRNKIEVCGHAADDQAPADWTFDDYVRLGTDRAQAVMDELMLRGIDRRRFRVSSAGPNEPAAQDVYDLSKRSMNRRVEIVVRESQIDDYVGQEPTPMPPTAQPDGEPVLSSDPAASPPGAS